MSREYLNYIDGRWQAADDGARTLDVNPARTDDVVQQQVEQTTAQPIEDGIAGSTRASPQERGFRVGKREPEEEARSGREQASCDHGEGAGDQRVLHLDDVIATATQQREDP